MNDCFKVMLKRKEFFIILMLLCAKSVLFGRDVTVYVEDTDLGIPLEGAVIRSWDGNEYVCDDDGIAIINAPDERQVSIQVIYPGYETGRIIIPRTGNFFKAALTLGGVMEGKELVIEAQRPGVSETKSGRSVAISGEALEKSAKIGLIEDVMTSIKLLPGVGYTGMFNALPSIRGGDPGDLMAVLDGFYIDFPYHWGGGFSIFDPNMIASAQLSHGIFSARYGHTISGLLELTSKKADPNTSELELGLSTSAVNINTALPLSGKGGVMGMGRITYWEPFFWAAKQLSKIIDSETLDMVNYITTAPFIRSAQLSSYYRFNSDLELSASFFAGGDGMGAYFINSSNKPVESEYTMNFLWNNFQTFFISGLAYNPRSSMVLKTTAGAGIHQEQADAKIEYDYIKIYRINSPDEYDEMPTENADIAVKDKGTMIYVQGRVDFDWSLGNGFLMAAGVQELYNHTYGSIEGKASWEQKLNEPDPLDELYPLYQIIKGLSPKQDIYIQFPLKGSIPGLKNRRYNSSAYILGEYTSPEKKFGAELGLRMDHLYFTGKNFTIQTMPVLNPRLNLDYNVFKERGIVESLDLTVGTGLFSSMNDAILAISLDNGLDDYALKPNRSWTSIAGLKMDFFGGWSFNIETYYKFVFDRAYQYFSLAPGKDGEIVFCFDGKGRVWGFDFMLQKFERRYWDGWLSYTFTHARYYEPVRLSINGMVIDDWYYPNFHRFHNLNLVLNIKPVKNFNIYTRLGLASGRPKPVPGKITEYQVIVLDENSKPVYDKDNKPLVITKYRRDMFYDDNSRTTWSIPLDLKLSLYLLNPRNKVQTEIYLAAENLASLVYVAKANSGFNSYTGKEETGSDSANYEMPIPMVSFGMRWSF
ncbi:MAG: TonB-dependent receptor plug domain-containing protein [Treponema sp.]|jgi:hypothetical protein|nr:TonB-dependent receptor plug domain-containing protein [Treponema sp.]